LQASTNAVETAHYLARPHQQWNIASAGGGFYKISNAADQNVLTVMDGNLAVVPFTGATNQLWKIDQLTDGSWRIKSKAGQLALTVRIKTNPGNGIALTPFIGDNAQRWEFAEP